MWAVVLVVVALFGWLSNQVAHRATQNQVDEQTRYSPPLKEMPPRSREAIINEDAAALHVEVDLDGTAVVYPEQVRGLVRSDGSFRTDLTLEELARVLNLNARRIATQDSRRINPDAVLFKVRIGRLTENSRASARRHREMEALERRGLPFGGYEWASGEESFTLNSLRRPTAAQQAVLNAISRSARLLPRQPGARINAVALESLSKAAEPQPFEFSAGLLPLEAARGDRGAPNDEMDGPR
jgi:hypothetical protein